MIKTFQIFFFFFKIFLKHLKISKFFVEKQNENEQELMKKPKNLLFFIFFSENSCFFRFLYQIFLSLLFNSSFFWGWFLSKIISAFRFATILIFFVLFSSSFSSGAVHEIFCQFKNLKVHFDDCSDSRFLNLLFSFSLVLCRSCILYIFVLSLSLSLPHVI